MRACHSRMLIETLGAAAIWVTASAAVLIRPFHMTTDALPLLRRVARDRYRPQLVARRGWAS